jgi:hypothetical protein
MVVVGPSRFVSTGLHDLLRLHEHGPVADLRIAQVRAQLSWPSVVSDLGFARDAVVNDLGYASEALLASPSPGIAR